MSCCTSSRRPALQAGVQGPGPSTTAPRLSAAPAFATQLQVVFELVHGASLQLHASGSGRHYRFDRTGDRQVVDPRDASMLARHPALRRL